MNSFIDGEALKLTELLVPWIAILFSIMIAFWLKDFAQNFLVGFKFRMSRAFNEGDKVLLDGNDAIVVKIGIRDTVFGVYSDKGYTWRYVPNVRIPYLKLEKIINAELHLDTDTEKAEKLQKMIDKYQDERIAQNQKAVEANHQAIKNLKGKK
jgi:small-conductance mechanosensitive channel|tara:strand:- start:432 stop:890 length:459 start_codon:yes stop_codon:yes gene_type:complete